MMDAIEKRARELLCGECDLDEEDYCEGLPVDSGDALRAIIAALAPPEGFVLVPVDTLQDLAADAEEYVRSTEFRRDRVETKLASVREAQAILAACPEVP